MHNASYIHNAHWAYNYCHSPLCNEFSRKCTREINPQIMQPILSSLVLLSQHCSTILLSVLRARQPFPINPREPGLGILLDNYATGISYEFTPQPSLRWEQLCSDFTVLDVQLCQRA